MKYGGPGNSDGKLHWYISGRSAWSTPFSPNVWHNCAYEIVRGCSTVGRSPDLTLPEFLESGSLLLAFDRRRAPEASNAARESGRVFGGLGNLTSFDSNGLQDGKDFHVGVLRLPGAGSNGKEDWYFSGVYIESGPITTAVSGPS